MRIMMSAHELGAAPPPRWKHQDESLDFFARNKRGFDNSDPGTGKTRVQVESFDNCQHRGRMLVLAPKTLMVSAWGNDVEKYAPRLTTSFAFADQRDEAFEMATDVVVLNTDGVKWLTDKKYPHRVKFLKDFSHLVIDEYTGYKNPSSLRSKAVAAVRKHFEYRRAMSGTPNPNSVMELWHPALILDDGQRLGTSYYGLRGHVQVPVQIGPKANHLRWDDKPGAAQAIHELLADITIRHAFEDVMTHVPPNHKDVKTFTLSARCKKLYDQMENESLLALDNGDVITSVHAASLRNKLLQIASGAVYDGNEDGSYKVLDPQRYELIADLVEEREHSITFFNWRHQRDLLTGEFQKRGISYALIDGTVTKDSERARIVDDYQAGKYRTLLIHPRTGAHGLTLTRGTTTIVSSPLYEADLLKQLIHRIYRGDQRQVTNTLLVQAQGTVEDLVYARLDAKYGRMLDLLDLMRQRRMR
jgi:SNF2 family DNA or RNA helicase